MYSKGLGISAESGWAAHILFFDQPRLHGDAEAGKRARFDRIEPLIMACPETNSKVMGLFVLREPGGSEMWLLLASDAHVWESLSNLIEHSDLLPGEDPLMDPEPDRVAAYAIVHGRWANTST